MKSGKSQCLALTKYVQEGCVGSRKHETEHGGPLVVLRSSPQTTLVDCMGVYTVIPNYRSNDISSRSSILIPVSITISNYLLLFKTSQCAIFTSKSMYFSKPCTMCYGHSHFVSRAYIEYDTVSAKVRNKMEVPREVTQCSVDICK